jgi:hypothetical protein
MSHEEVSYEDLIAYAANELHSQDMAKVKRYLESHPDALQTVARYQTIRALLLGESKQIPSLRATAHAQGIFRWKDKKRKSGRSSKFMCDVFFKMRHVSTRWKVNPSRNVLAAISVRLRRSVSREALSLL